MNIAHIHNEDGRMQTIAIINMFENDRSAARGKMAVRELIVFRHDSELGNAFAYRLFDTVTVERKDKSAPARNYSDYRVTVNETSLPQGLPHQ